MAVHCPDQTTRASRIPKQALDNWNGELSEWMHPSAFRDPLIKFASPFLGEFSFDSPASHFSATHGLPVELPTPFLPIWSGWYPLWNIGARLAPLRTR